MRLQVLVVSVLVTAIILAGAWVSAMPAAVPTWTPFPSDTPLVVNGTTAVIQRTADAYGTASAPLLQFPTQDPSIVTDNTDVDGNLIDPIYVTATYIVGRATQTEAYFMTATANPIAPIFLTATAVVAQATQLQAAYMTATAGGTFTLPTTFPTAVPTLSDEESTVLLKQWTATLEQATGFSHPLLDNIAYDFLRQIQLDREISNQFSSFQPDLEIKPIVTHVKFAGNEYVALVVREPVTWFGTLWMFRVTDSEPILVLGDLPFSLGGLYGDLDPAQYAFNDFNENGLPDVIVNYHSGGSCPSNRLGLFEIRPDGNIINVAKMIPGNGSYEPGLVAVDTQLYLSIIRFETVDVNQDGIPEIKVVGKYFDFPEQLNASCFFLPMTRYYAWGGNGYQDITSTLDESYYPSIDAYFKSVEELGCSLPSSQVIIDYFVLGRLKEGWTRIASQMHLEMCPAETLVGQGEAIGKFLAWVGMLLELEQQNQSKTST